MSKEWEKRFKRRNHRGRSIPTWVTKISQDRSFGLQWSNVSLMKLQETKLIGGPVCWISSALIKRWTCLKNTMEWTLTRQNSWWCLFQCLCLWGVTLFKPRFWKTLSRLESLICINYRWDSHALFWNILRAAFSTARSESWSYLCQSEESKRLRRYSKRHRSK